MISQWYNKNAIPEAEAVESAQFLLKLAQQQLEQAIIDLMTTIIVYKVNKWIGLRKADITPCSKLGFTELKSTKT